MSSRMLVAVSILALTAACQDTSSIAAPATEESQPIMAAVSSSLFSVYSGDDVPPPTVRVIHSGTATGFAGIPVSFIFSDRAVVKATTDAHGFASANWPIDYTKSADSVLARADGVSQTVMFKALITPIVATYKLQSIAGQTLPITYNGGGQTWSVTGGRYRLFGDGTYRFGYEENGKQQWGAVLPYVSRDSTIEFYLSPGSAPQSSFYAGVHYLFSTATLHADMMSVKYTDPIDFEDEIYALQ